MKKFLKISTAVFMAAIFFVLSSSFANAEEILQKGAGVYKFEEPTGKTDSPIDIYYYRPKNWKDGDKIFVAFHGSGRNAKPFVTGLKKISEQQNFLLICPEFSKEKYPGGKNYNYGHVLIDNEITPKDEWTYNTANRIIDDIKNRMNVKKSKITFFGFSAGSQFMSRYIFLADKIKADRIISASARSYMFPDENRKYPTGLKNSPVTEKDLKRAYNYDVIIMVGENDLKKINKNFNRLELGKNFFEQSKQKAESLGTKFNWRFITVPNVGHAGNKMAKNALRYLK